MDEDDTPDLRLARWGVSLRRRAGEGWTLKLAPPPSAPRKRGVVLERDELMRAVFLSKGDA